MNQEKLYKENLKRAASTFSPQFAQSVDASETSHLHTCFTDIKERNLQSTKEGEPFLYHSPQGALDEAIHHFSSLNLSRAEILYIYGTGLAYSYDAAKPWLEKNENHYLVYLEDDLSTLKKLFETEKGSSLLKDPQVYIFTFKHVDQLPSLCKKLQTLFITLHPVLDALPLYKKTKKDIIDKIQEKLISPFIEFNAYFSEYLSTCPKFYKNYYGKLLRLPSPFFASDLFQQFKNIPAIICGASPSLTTTLPLLKKLKNRALIIASGSSINAFQDHSFSPHISLCIDPNHSQTEHVLGNTAFNTPLFYSHRLAFDSLHLFNGPKVLLPTADGYSITFLFNERFQIPNFSPIEKGCSATCSSLSLAHSLGCNPVILCGIDLSFQNDKKYAKNIPQNHGKSFDSFNPWWETFETQNVRGNPTQTTQSWFAEAKWLSQFCQKHKNLSVIQTTEKGLTIQGAQNLSFHQSSQLYLSKQHNIENRLHAAISSQSHPSPQTKDAVLFLIDLYESLERCSTFLEESLKDVFNFGKRLIKKQVLFKDLQSQVTHPFNEKIKEEIAFTHILLEMKNHYSKTLLKEVHRLQRFAEKGHDLDYLDIEVQGLMFLKEAAEHHLDVIAEVLDNYEEEIGRNTD